MASNIRLAPLLLLLIAGCGGSAPPPPAPHAPPRSPTVFDDLVEKKRELPAEVVAAQQRHMDEARKAIDGPDSPPPAESPR